MRILLIAYDYPPLASPQAIRWYYLSRELARQGAEVHVLAPDLPVGGGAALPVPPGVVVHRSPAGGLAGWIGQRRRNRHAAVPGVAAVAPERPSTGLNWKGRLYRRLDRLVGLWCFPDSRGQWLKPARQKLAQLLPALVPDVVISSHEPATTLQLGLAMAGRVPVWMADLGDPVLAPYTPPRWRARARALERDTCHEAAAISVTTEGTRRLLIERHGVDPAKLWVLTQGFDDALARPWSNDDPPLRGREVRLFYAGRFYPFRNPAALLRAVCATPGVRLAIVAPEVAPEYLAIAAGSGGRIEFLGERAHADVLRMQLECDVLVNIGNALDAQIPGKLYEYLGSGKPILHLSSTEDDPVVPLLQRWGRGWACANEPGPIECLLRRLAGDFSTRKAELKVDEALVGAHGWSRLAAALLERCGEELVKEPATSRGNGRGNTT